MKRSRNSHLTREQLYGRYQSVALALATKVCGKTLYHEREDVAAHGLAWLMCEFDERDVRFSRDPYIRQAMRFKMIDYRRQMHGHDRQMLGYLDAYLHGHREAIERAGVLHDQSPDR